MIKRLSLSKCDMALVNTAATKHIDAQFYLGKNGINVINFMKF